MFIRFDHALRSFKGNCNQTSTFTRQLKFVLEEKKSDWLEKTIRALHKEKVVKSPVIHTKIKKFLWAS